MNSLIRLSLLGAAVLAPMAASAAPTHFGAAARLTARNCNGIPNAENCLGVTNPNTRIVQEVFGGGPGGPNTSMLSPAAGGYAVSDVSYGLFDLPTIKAGAFAGADNRVNSNTVGYQSFVYGGTSATPFGLSAVFDYLSSGAPVAAATPADEAAPEIAGEGFGFLRVSLIDPAFLPPLLTAQDILNYGFGQGCGEAGVLGTSSTRLASATAGPASGALTLNIGCDGNPILLTPGQEIVAVLLLQTPSNRLGFFDATNTIVLGLDPALSDEVIANLEANLVSARSLVPEPAAWALMIAGFGFVGAALRRRPMVAAPV